MTDQTTYEYLDDLDGRLRKVETTLAGQQNTADILDAAIEAETVVTFRYTKLDGTWGVRIVSPYEWNDTATGRHLVAYDHARHGLRQFNAKRIAGAQPDTTATFMEPIA